jgi:aminoglycoside phosphotransferase family enzyme/adenylate kinase family enzyme
LPACQDQADVIAFLSDPASYARRPSSVDRIETHGALVFLAGDEVFKIKRAVKFSYMDFSMLDLRRRASQREIEINRPGAPEIYLGLLCITREGEGKLAWGGAGEVVEWVVHMRRFPQQNLLSAVAAEGPLAADICRDLADAVLEFHAKAVPAAGVDTPANLRSIVSDLKAALLEHADVAGSPDLEAFVAGAARGIARAQGALDARSASGCVRRCHGDLHLGNIVLWQGRPLLFDALEFDEAMATVDTLYDLAFLLMDLDHSGQRVAANRVLNRYMSRSSFALDIQGLVALPVFLALRAGVRAMVSAQRASQAAEADALPGRRDAAKYLSDAAAYVAPPPPRLVAVGGLSGTGKSTVAAELAPALGAAPGALHLRTDVVRKVLFAVGETDRLGAETYTSETSAKVYAAVLEKAKLALLAGHSVIVDAVFARADEREAVERVAGECGVRFDGLWLEAPAEIMIERVERRRGDASDATTEVVRRQLEWDLGEVSWTRVSAAGAPVEVLDLAVNAVYPPA